MADQARDAAAFDEIVRFERIDSTNRYARDAAETGGAHGLVVVAAEQTAGRGRLGRHWSAPAGSSLLCSVLFRPPLVADRLHLVPTLVALAALDAVDAVVGYGAALKWPNDLVAGSRKLAGVLAEVVAPTSAVIVGLGLNVAWPPGWPAPGQSEELDEIARRSTTLERLAGAPVEVAAVEEAFLMALRARYSAALTSGFDRMLVDYRRRCSTIGREVRVVLGDGEVEGEAVDVTEGGRLLVLSDGELRSFDAGDVVHLR